MTNEVANTLSMRAFFNIFQSWVSQIQISCIENLPFYMPKIIIQDAVSQITNINHIQITRKELKRRLFNIRCLSIWNSLPVDTVNSNSVKKFMSVGCCAGFQKMLDQESYRAGAFMG